MTYRDLFLKFTGWKIGDLITIEDKYFNEVCITTPSDALSKYANKNVLMFGIDYVTLEIQRS